MTAIIAFLFVVKVHEKLHLFYFSKLIFRFQFQMKILALQSWKINSPFPFFPMFVQCIGFEAEYAISVYTVHTVNTLIFRNFTDAIERDKAPQKSYLLESLRPEQIKNVAIGSNETVILMKNGELKFFVSPKKLRTVDYLSDVKAICSCREGFALIKMIDYGRKFLIELHPDSFHGDDSMQVNERQSFDISFDGGLSRWTQSAFHIKQIHFAAAHENKFVQKMMRCESETLKSHGDYFFFYSVEKEVFTLLVDASSELGYSIVPVANCSSKVIDFWPLTNGKMFALLLETGAMQVLRFNEHDNEITKEFVYFGSEISSFSLIEDIFIYSNESTVEAVRFGCDETSRELVLKRESKLIYGIAALTVVRDLNIIVAVSENCQFYVITLELLGQGNSSERWIVVDDDIKRQLKQLKYEFIEMNEAYVNLVALQSVLTDVLAAMKMKLAETKMSEKCFYFVGKCSVAKAPQRLTSCDNFRAINVDSALIYDQNTSFFVQIVLTAVIYANEFKTNIWHLRCRWINDRDEYEYVNLKLTADFMSQPLTVSFHLNHRRLPRIECEVNTIAQIGKAIVYVSFPVRMTYDFSRIFSFHKATKKSAVESDFVCALGKPRNFSLNHLIGETNRTTAEMESVIIEMCLLSSRKMLLSPLAESVELRTDDVDLMYYGKRRLLEIIETISADNEQAFRVSSNASKEYSVSELFSASNRFARPNDFIISSI